MKLKRPSFETVYDIQKESQTVPESIKENYFHGAFEAWKKKNPMGLLHTFPRRLL
jgi:hypothetical protein